jgi:hypothetical protein
MLSLKQEAGKNFILILALKILPPLPPYLPRNMGVKFHIDCGIENFTPITPIPSQKYGGTICVYNIFYSKDILILLNRGT